MWMSFLKRLLGGSGGDPELNAMADQVRREADQKTRLQADAEAEQRRMVNEFVRYWGPTIKKVLNDTKEPLKRSGRFPDKLSVQEGSLYKGAISHEWKLCHSEFSPGQGEGDYDKYMDLPRITVRLDSEIATNTTPNLWVELKWKVPSWNDPRVSHNEFNEAWLREQVRLPVVELINS